jgi:hypothetical protein
MPKKKKLQLKALKVRSFVTELGNEARKVRGGESAETNCDPTCEAPCVTNSCATCATCNTCYTTCYTCTVCNPTTEEESCEGECDL